MNWAQSAYAVFLLVLYMTFIPVGVKWQLSLKIVMVWTTVMAVLGLLTLHFLDGQYPQMMALSQVAIVFSGSLLITVVSLLINFFRDPERVPPAGENLILSPADGRVVYVKQIHGGAFPFAVKKGREVPLREFAGSELIPNRGIQIGIGMNLLNVHVNRTPIKGRVLRVGRLSGKYHSLRKVSSLLENERVTTIIGNGTIQVGVVQIASRLVRRIVTYVKENDEVETGQRIGAILLGSQVDVLIPHQEKLEVVAGQGQEVRAGESILARF